MEHAFSHGEDVMATTLLRSLITYVISELKDRDASFGKTKLVKLLYLIDVEIYRRRGKTLSGLEWRFCHYGPYAFEIDTALKELDLDIPQEETLTKAGHRAFIFKPGRDVEAGLEEQFASADKLVIDRVVREWSMEDLNKILDYVYFKTGPMVNAKRGEVLDFSTVRRISIADQMTPPIGLPAEKLLQLKARFQELKEKQPQRVRRPLSPPPRFDEEYDRALRLREQEERYLIPRGKIELDEASKQELRKLGEP